MSAEQLEIPGLESSLEERLRERVRAIGGITVKLAPTARGVPDRLVLLPGGWSYLVELKTTTGRLSPIQRAWHERVSALGHRVVVLYGAEAIDAWVADRG